MQTSAPVFRLRYMAKRLAKQVDIPLHQALDQIAVQEGFQAWSHLVCNQPASSSPADQILERLTPGQMILLGARPGQGKTLLGLELICRAHEIARLGQFFTLDYHERDIAERLHEIGRPAADLRHGIEINTSDEICAAHIIRHTKAAALNVVDYLQLLDQSRSTPPLAVQVQALRDHCRASGAICLVISQIDRSFDLSGRTMPSPSDVRLPNPLDLSLFDACCFLHQGKIAFKPGAG